MSAITSFQVEPENQFHRLPAVLARYGISTSTLYRWISQQKFVPPEKLGPNLVAWRESALREYDKDPQGWASGQDSTD